MMYMIPNEGDVNRILAIMNSLQNENLINSNNKGITSTCAKIHANKAYSNSKEKYTVINHIDYLIIQSITRSNYKFARTKYRTWN